MAPPQPGSLGEIIGSDKLGKGLDSFGGIPGINPVGKLFPLGTKLGNVLSSLFEVIIVIAVVLSFFWLVWGAFHYLFAGGNKEELAKARNRIIWAIVGLLLVMLSFLIAQLAVQILHPQFLTPIG